MALQLAIAQHHLAIAAHPTTPLGEAIAQRQHARQLLETMVEDRSAASVAGFDQVLISLALLRMGVDDQGMKTATLRLIREQPQSPVVPMAFVVFGDVMFEQGDREAAAKVYEKAAAFQDSAVEAYARYRQAWSLLPHGDSPGDSTKSLELFVQAIERAEHALAEQRESKPQLAPGQARVAAPHEVAAAARRELVIAYADVGQPHKAWPFFARIGRGREGHDMHVEMMVRLARVYRERSRFDEAAQVCAALAEHTEGTVPCP